MPKAGECFAFGSGLTTAHGQPVEGLEMKNKKRWKWLDQLRLEKQHVGKSRQERLNFLISWADVKVGSPRTRTRATKRMWWRDKPRICWCCWSTRELHRHHIVQVQNGGRNHHTNFVFICQLCHAEIHPWLPVVPGMLDIPEPGAEFKHLP